MLYSEIKSLALAYADRSDNTKVVSNIDSFIKIVESRMNRFLRTTESQVRAIIITVADQEYYELPEGFDGVVDLEIRETDDSKKRYTLDYLTPEQMNILAGNENNQSTLKGYSIVADQLQIMPPQDGMVMEMIYFRKVVGLDSTNTTNWLSINHPDCYIFGLVVEIYNFVKNFQAAQMWDERFKSSLSEINSSSDLNRWSGNSLSAKVDFKVP
jgi:hypothetical protein